MNYSATTVKQMGKVRYVIQGPLIGPGCLEAIEAASLLVVRLYLNIYLT